MAIVRIAGDGVTLGYSHSPSVIMLTGAGLSAVTSGDVIRGDDVAFGTDLRAWRSRTTGLGDAAPRAHRRGREARRDGEVGRGVNGAVHVGDYVT